MSYFNYTIGLPNEIGGELYCFDSELSKLGGPDQPYASIVLTRPLAGNINPIFSSKPDTKFTKLIIREYDRFNNLMKMVEYKDVTVIKLEQGPNVILEFSYKP